MTVRLHNTIVRKWPQERYALRAQRAHVHIVDALLQCKVLVRARSELLHMGNASHVAVWAALLMGFFGFFRKSNLAVKSASVFSDGKCLRAGDIRVDKDYCLVVTPPGSKTRQYGAAPAVVVAGCPGHPLDPVEAWMAHVRMSAAALANDRAAFSHSVGTKVVALTHANVVQACKEMARAAGFDPAEFAAHSLRRGGATWAFASGAPEVLVQRQGDWLSACYKAYIELSRSQTLRCTQCMFAGMPAERATVWAHVAMPAAASPSGHLAGGDAEYMAHMV